MFKLRNVKEMCTIIIMSRTGRNGFQLRLGLGLLIELALCNQSCGREFSFEKWW